jgi:hypothetical protein
MYGPDIAYFCGYLYLPLALCRNLAPHLTVS